MMQALNRSSYTKKFLITNKVTTDFLLRPSNQYDTPYTHAQLRFLG